MIGSCVAVANNACAQKVPTDYGKCQEVSTQDKITELACSVEFPAADKEKFDTCVGMGGSLTYVNSCILSFYNPDYEFPKNFSECHTQQKGGDLYTRHLFTDKEHIQQRCGVYVDPYLKDYDQKAIDILIKKCWTSGGEIIPSKACVLNYDDVDILIEISGTALNDVREEQCANDQPCQRGILIQADQKYEKIKSLEIVFDKNGGCIYQSFKNPFTIKKGERIKVFGRLINQNILSLCGSQTDNYYIK